MAQIESSASICPSYTKKQTIHFICLPYSVFPHLLWWLPLVLPIAWCFLRSVASSVSRLPSFAFTEKDSEAISLQDSLFANGIISLSAKKSQLFSLMFQRTVKMFVCYLSGGVVLHVIIIIIQVYFHYFNLFDQVSFEFSCIRAVWKCVSRICWRRIMQTKLSRKQFVCIRNMHGWNAFQELSVFI